MRSPILNRNCEGARISAYKDEHARSRSSIPRTQYATIPTDLHRSPAPGGALLFPTGLFCFLLETQSIQRESRESQSHCVPTEQHTHAGGAGRCEPLAAPPTRWRDRRSRVPPWVPRYFGFAIAATEGRYVSQVATSQHTRREERAGSVQRQTPKTCGARWNRSHTREALGEE